jgi:hypothetical protein
VSLPFHVSHHNVSHLPATTAKALRLNFTEMLPKIMPLREKADFAVNYASRKLLRRHSVKPYRPDLRKCAEHICIHTGALAGCLTSCVRLKVTVSDSHRCRQHAPLCWSIAPL